jgi:hypothetical protein
VTDTPRQGTPWLDVLKNMDAGVISEVENGLDVASSSEDEFSESLNQQAAKSAKSLLNTLLSLLAPPHIKDPERCAPRQECRAKGNATKERPWSEALKSLDEEVKKQEKSETNSALPSVEKIPESLIQRGAKSAKRLLSTSDTEENSGVVDEEAKPREARRTLVTTQDQMSGVVADLKNADLVALDQETTGLDPRNDSIRLLSLATKAATYIVDCQSVDPAELFSILTEATVVAHNALFDVGFLSSLGFIPGKAVDTMILSQLLHAGSKVEPLKRGQTSHSLDSVVERELGLEFDKTHQSSD